ncbi:phage protein NinX family protein [Proteus genomosp. 6]|uniref:phage protein NinX family protein n=1 Tax=Proteus genomosp. 6 TaxID=1311820 RepID=UPI000D68BF22|nr:phage protein NinX family protein [Proteus genomosp. 6]
MNKYTELSDFEINKKVAEKLGAEWFVTTTVWDELVVMVGNKCFKPSNNPADAMPIIIENKIGMNFIGNIVGWSASHICESKGELEVYDKNYYRAAMMCFLIMKDAENEKV